MINDLIAELANHGHGPTTEPIELDDADFDRVRPALIRGGLTSSALAAARDHILLISDRARAFLDADHDGFLCGYLTLQWCGVVATVALNGEGVPHAIVRPHLLRPDYLDECRGPLPTALELAVPAASTESSAEIIRRSLSGFFDLGPGSATSIGVTSTIPELCIRVLSAPTDVEDDLWANRGLMRLGAEDRWVLDPLRSLLVGTAVRQHGHRDEQWWVQRRHLLDQASMAADHFTVDQIIATAEAWHVTQRLRGALRQAVVAFGTEPANGIERWATA